MCMRHIRMSCVWLTWPAFKASCELARSHTPSCTHKSSADVHYTSVWSFPSNSVYFHAVAYGDRDADLRDSPAPEHIIRLIYSQTQTGLWSQRNSVNPFFITFYPQTHKNPTQRWSHRQKPFLKLILEHNSDCVLLVTHHKPKVLQWLAQYPEFSNPLGRLDTHSHDSHRHKIRHLKQPQPVMISWRNLQEKHNRQECFSHDSMTRNKTNRFLFWFLILYSWFHHYFICQYSCSLKKHLAVQRGMCRWIWFDLLSRKSLPWLSLITFFSTGSCSAAHKTQT